MFGMILNGCKPFVDIEALYSALCAMTPLGIVIEPALSTAILEKTDITVYRSVTANTV